MVEFAYFAKSDDVAVCSGGIIFDELVYLTSFCNCGILYNEECGCL